MANDSDESLTPDPKREPARRPEKTSARREVDLGVSRRDLLKRAGIVVSTALVPQVTHLSPSARAAASLPSLPQDADAGPRPLSREEYDTLDAICGRLIPTDETGPGAREARAVRYIDHALDGTLASFRETYIEGLAALDRFSVAARGPRFLNLSEEDQDAMLVELEEDRVPGFEPASSAFFNLVRNHTLQGTFSDPFYGGNANFIGWDLIGYPGVRLAVSAEYQELDGDHEANHTSVYDFPMFEEGDV